MRLQNFHLHQTLLEVLSKIVQGEEQKYSDKQIHPMDSNCKEKHVEDLATAIEDVKHDWR